MRTVDCLVTIVVLVLLWYRWKQAETVTLLEIGVRGQVQIQVWGTFLGEPDGVKDQHRGL